VNLDAARRIADAVLYEGYLLYPYRASAPKNRSRWQFGVLMPPRYVERDPSERSWTQTECVLEHGDRVALAVLVRFLQVQRRAVSGRDDVWDEAVEREVRVDVDAAQLLGDGVTSEFTIEGGRDVEDPVTRTRTPLRGKVSVLAQPLPGPWRAVRLRIRVDNDTDAPDRADRQAALPSALVAAHTLITVDGGAFLSMVDPPEWARAAVEACENIGTWPVLVGPPGRRDVVLSAPIILYDHVELAPESPGDLFDGTEIDEILTLRTLALSDEEKREARATDPRAAALLDRTEALDAEALARMHGRIRPVSPDPEVHVGGRRLTRGSAVRLRPGIRRADAQDMFLAGRPAVVEAVLRDLEDNPYLAVTLADDAAADLQRSHGRFLYFAPDEVEPL
jgi:hypothetical protein